MLSKFKMMLMVVLACCCLTTIYASDNAQMIRQPMTAAEQQSITPEQALARLKAGNQRFVDNKPLSYDFPAIRKASADSQFPFAVVLTCLDSRSSPDITFDEGLGNIFIARVAGNVVNPDILGSMEFATKVAGAKLIVVMGHTSCGAVQGACKGVGDGNLKTLLDRIQPAVKEVAKDRTPNCEDMNYVNQIARQNVIDQVKNIYNDSPVIKQLVDEGKVMLVGAMHDLKAGKTDFFYQFKPE
jgi:carbonic anhydrase